MADQNNWIDSDYQAVGVISLYIKEDLRTAIARNYDAAHTSLTHITLANLATIYATTGPTGQFYLFREIVNWRIGNKEPSAEIAHLQDLFAWLTGAGLDLPVNLRAMLICTGLGDNYSNLVTTIVHMKATAQFTPNIIIPMILAESQQQGTSLTHRISADPARIINKADNSKHCKICRGTSHITENSWQKTGKHVSAGNQQNQQRQQ
jgi:hypothetical protein